MACFMLSHHAKKEKERLTMIKSADGNFYENIDRLFHAWQGHFTAGVSPDERSDLSDLV